MNRLPGILNTREIGCLPSGVKKFATRSPFVLAPSLMYLRPFTGPNSGLNHGLTNRPITRSSPLGTRMRATSERKGPVVRSRKKTVSLRTYCDDNMDRSGSYGHGMHIKAVIVFGIPFRVAGNRSQGFELVTPSANWSAVRVAQQYAAELGTRSQSARELTCMLTSVLTARADFQQLQNS